MAIVSLRAYAKHRGVSLRAVQKAIQSGRIQTTPDGKIDTAQADDQWDRNTAPRAEHHREQRTIAGTAQRRTSPPAPEVPRADFGATGGLDFARARAAHETYKARLAKLAVDEKLRKLINADEVAVAAFNRFRGLRDRLLNIPDQLAPVLAAETDQHRIHELLVTALRKALIEFADAATQDG